MRPVGGSVCRWVYKLQSCQGEKSPTATKETACTHIICSSSRRGDTRVVSLINDPLAFDGCVYGFQRAVDAVCRENAVVAKASRTDGKPFPPLIPS